jgi:hypothetical protein
MAYRFTPADRGAFKRCRRQWDFGARERQNYEPAGPAGVPDLDLAVRDALAVYYFPGMWDWQRSVVLPLVLQGFARSMGRQPGAGEEALAAGDGLLRRYFDWAPGVDRFSPIQVECAFEVNLPDPAGGDRELVLADGRPIRYQGRADLLAGDEHDRYWIVAHRLVDRFGPADELLLDEELVAACWAMERLYPGMRVAGTVHNELRRPAPTGDPAGRSLLAVGRRPAPSRWRRSRHQRGLPQHEASGGGRSLPYARRGVARPGPSDAEAVASQGDGEFRRTRIRRDRAKLEAMGPGWPPRPWRWSTPGCPCTRARPRSTAGPASSWARAWPWSAAATSGPCSRPASATGARSRSSRAASAPPPGAWAGARPHPGSTPAER